MSCFLDSYYTLLLLQTSWGHERKQIWVLFSLLTILLGCKYTRKAAKQWHKQKAIQSAKFLLFGNRMSKWKSQSEGEVVQIKFPKPTKTKSHFEKWGGWTHGSCEGMVQHMEKVAWWKETDKEQVTVRNTKWICLVGTQSPCYENNRKQDCEM